MLGNLSTRKRNIVIFFALFITTALNYFFNNGTFESACICISIGFAIGFYFYYGKDTLKYILLGILLASLISRVIFLDETLISTTAKSVGFVGVNLFIMVVLKKIVTSFNVLYTVSLKSTTIFITSSILLSVFAGLIIAIMTIFNEVELDTSYLSYGTAIRLGTKAVYFDNINHKLMYRIYLDDVTNKSSEKELSDYVHDVTFTLDETSLDIILEIDKYNDTDDTNNEFFNYKFSKR